jgi:hypothetical protein
LLRKRCNQTVWLPSPEALRLWQVKNVDSQYIATWNEKKQEYICSKTEMLVDKGKY